MDAGIKWELWQLHLAWKVPVWFGKQENHRAAKEAFPKLVFRRPLKSVILLRMQWTQNHLHGRAVYISKGCLAFLLKREASHEVHSRWGIGSRVMSFLLEHHKYPQKETFMQGPGDQKKKRGNESANSDFRSIKGRRWESIPFHFSEMCCLESGWEPQQQRC